MTSAGSVVRKGTGQTSAAAVSIAAEVPHNHETITGKGRRPGGVTTAGVTRTQETVKKDRMGVPVNLGKGCALTVVRKVISELTVQKRMDQDETTIGDSEVGHMTGTDKTVDMKTSDIKKKDGVDHIVVHVKIEEDVVRTASSLSDHR